MKANSGTLDFDTYRNIITEALHLNDLDTPQNPIMSYPDRVSHIRAYIYSCCSGTTNTSEISDECFLAGCNRFAIENPVASISMRCGLYGN